MDLAPSVAVAILVGGCSAPSTQPVDCTSQEAPSPCVLRVDRDSEQPGCGQEWGKAYHHVQEAVDQAHRFVEEESSLTECEVWVAEGTYSVFEERHSDTLQLRPGVRLYGGFSGQEAHLEDRDPAAHITTLDGREDGGGERVYHVVTGASDALLDGFTVTRGWARSSRYGGGMYNDGVSPRLVGCRFVDNESGFYGGAIFNSLNELLVEDCTFVDNRALYGGAIHIQGGTATITGSTFERNEVEENGGAIAAISYVELAISGGAMRANRAGELGGALCTDYHTTAVLDGCAFEGNEAGEEGDDVHDSANSTTTILEGS